MAYITCKSTEVRPNFLDSENGLITKTAQVDDTGIMADEYGYKILKGGTVYPSNDANAKGIIFEDVDVTHGERAASIIVAGRIIAGNLHTEPAAAAKTALAKTGILFVDQPVVSRVLIEPVNYMASAGTAFSAADIASTDDGSPLTITEINADNDKSIATVAISDGNVTATKVKTGSTKITCTLTDKNGGTEKIVVPIKIV